MACRPDPEAMAINAFTLSWSGIQFYAFPPFCIIPSMLQKMTKDNHYPGGSGCAILAQSGVVSKTSKHADINPSAAREDILQLPMDLRAKRHLRKHLRLLIRKISGVISEAQVFCCFVF